MADPKSTPEGDADLARQALAAGDLPHAIHHVGCALASNPVNADWMALLAQIVGAAPDPMKLVEIEGDTSFIDAANRSYVLAWMRKWEEALDLITDVAEIRPDIPYLLWAEWWLGQPGVAASIPFDAFARGILIDLAKISMRCPVGMDKEDPRRANVETAARIINGIRGIHADKPFVWFTGALIARRLGTFAEGLAMAQQAYQLEPAWNNAVAVANLLADQKKIDEAAQWYRRALDHDKTDASAHVDMGDMFLGAGRFDEAIAEYEKAVKKEPDHAWAVPSIHYARFKQTKDPTQRLCLLRLTEGGNSAERARQLAQELDPPMTYVTNLPRPGDASCNALNHIFEQMFENPASHANSTVKLKLSHLESPSCVIAFWLQMEMWGLKSPHATLIALDYQVDTIQQPDPRSPKAQVPYVLWAWEGTNPRPAVPPPDPRVQREIQQIAMEPFHLEIWVPLAEKLGRELGPQGIPSILSTMVYPPRPNGGSWRVLNWTQRVQVAAALVAAHVDAAWAGSERQRALYSLAYGPSDWTVGAALIALGVLARKDPAIRGDVEQAFAWLRSQVPPQGFCAWEYPLVCTWISLGAHPPDKLKDLEAWKDRVENEEGKSTVHMVEIEAKKFDQAAEMQKAQQAAQQIAAGGGGDPDPTVFPGQKVPKLSDYVGLMKQMQAGNMMGALGALGLDIMSYGQVAQAWGQKLAADPGLNAKFAAMMQR
jgi:tetratricopeptide (TPR) repeat protein